MQDQNQDFRFRLPHYILFLILLCGSGYLFFLLKAEKREPSVKLHNRQFLLNGKPFFPVALNYLVSMQFDGQNIWPFSSSDYQVNQSKITDKKTALHQLQAEFTLIRDMGFNTVRVVGIGEPSIDEQGDGHLEIYVLNSQGKGASVELRKDSSIQMYLNAVEDLFNTAHKAGLQVIYLVRLRPQFASTHYLLRKFCKRFKDHPALMAIDIYNEPLYFDQPEKLKDEIYGIVQNWRKIIRTYAPQKLVTIGLVGIREVFRWDPNILDVDFISYHPYEYEPEQVRNELYWYGKHTRKPWIIGETSIPADNDSVPYSEQAAFARKTLRQALACGASGYSWWQYKDVNWQKYHASYMGLVNRQGFTLNSKADTVDGSVKPAGWTFKEPLPERSSLQCLQLPNYENYSDSHAFRLNGKVTDEQGRGINGAVVLAWNEFWSHSYHTVTKSDGSFELLGSYPFFHWIASATDYTMVRGDVFPERAVVQNGMPTVDLKELRIRKFTPR
jgi:hypothetical protein